MDKFIELTGNNKDKSLINTKYILTIKPEYEKNRTLKTNITFYNGDILSFIETYDEIKKLLEEKII